MDKERLENALDEFLMCVSSLEYSINGYCTFETASFKKRDEHSSSAHGNIVLPSVQNRSSEVSPFSDSLTHTANATDKEKAPVSRNEAKTQYNQIALDLQKFLTDKDETPSITPNMLKKEFLHCKNCSRSNIKRVLGEGDIAQALVFVLTDTIPLDSERAYLDKVLSSIRLEIGKNAYLTSLIKCEGGKIDTFDEDLKQCSSLLEKQLSLTSSRAFIAFGAKSASYLKEVKKRDAFGLSAFIYSSSLSELERDKAQKEKLWASFKKLVRFLNLPRV